MSVPERVARTFGGRDRLALAASCCAGQTSVVVVHRREASGGESALYT